MKAFLGMGHLGSNFVKAMINKGEEVQVWNRTASKAQALESVGAKAFEEITDAVRNADVIHLTLKDDAAVNEVLDKASSAFKPGVIIMDHTTTSVEGSVERTKEWKARGYTYLHVPVFMGPQNALESTGSMLVSGDQELIQSVQPQLEKMTGKVINFGDKAGMAAGMKLLGNHMLIAITAGLTDTFALAKAMNISKEDLSALFDSWNPATSFPARLKKISGGDFDNPTWELSMARKDAGLMMAEAKAGDTDLMVLPHVIASMDNWISKGHGKDDWTIIAKDAL
ncbi:NAD(P)-dependent oxidoreductase [Taibaiella lutea]|uniref:NAD(P)-dependent oxidoreductase n=1 Tax=Taibaiella lutea TaxID=2608001 RepID=A0A5M6CM23_9BACT|nr:NAD(P)-dependent oxidoreductase [Taibaiella lutea]KAA5536103.1 NAD(P)-dependent oxidoreductase [Taibaiella lutea]